MKTRTFVSATTALCILAVPALAADNWAGQYEGIDPLTGAKISLRIEPQQVGPYNIVVNTPQHSLCSGTAKIVGTGIIEDDQMLRLDTVVNCAGAEPILTSPDIVYFQDRDQEMIYAEVPTDNRRIDYYRVHQQG